MTAWEEANGQLALFEAPTHEHVFVVYKGPHVVCPADTIVLRANRDLFRWFDRTIRYCWGCREHVEFDHEGNEVPSQPWWQ